MSTSVASGSVISSILRAGVENVPALGSIVYGVLWFVFTEPQMDASCVWLLLTVAFNAVLCTRINYAGGGEAALWITVAFVLDVSILPITASHTAHKSTQNIWYLAFAVVMITAFTVMWWLVRLIEALYKASKRADLAQSYDLTPALVDRLLLVYNGEFPVLELTQLWQQAVKGKMTRQDWHTSVMRFMGDAEIGKGR